MMTNLFAGVCRFCGFQAQTVEYSALTTVDVAPDAKNLQEGLSTFFRR